MKEAEAVSEGLREIVISREDAVFWMDGNGRWRNRHGKFEKRSVIDHFNAAIRRDEGGYYVGQVKGTVREKVYFRHEGTPLFVTAVDETEGGLALTLNTGRRLALVPERLWVAEDSLYLADGEERIKFTDRALMKIADHFDEEGGTLRIVIGGRSVPIPEAEGN